MTRVQRLLMLSGEIPFGQQVMTGVLAYCRTRGHWEFHTEVYRGEPTLKRCRFAVKHWKAHGIIVSF